MLGFVLHNCWVFGFSFRWRASDGYRCSSDKEGKSKDRTREKGVKKFIKKCWFVAGGRRKEKERKGKRKRECCWRKEKKDLLEQKPAQGWDETLLWDPIACEKLQKLPLS